MALSQDEIQQLLQQLSEGLYLEMKSWIDPATDDAKKKIIKATYALYNRNGGYLFIGFDNHTGQPLPLPHGMNFDPKDAYASDAIQQLVAGYASTPFAIDVGFAEINGTSYPVIKVPSGVQVPVALKKPFPANGTGLKKDEIYFRTLVANNTVSSAIIQYPDLPDLLSICFDNRESDIGRFLRRHLTPEALSAFCGNPGGVAVGQPVADPEPDVVAFLDRRNLLSRVRIENVLAQIGRTDILDFGTMNIAALAVPRREGVVATANFLNTALQANPRLTGWPAWPDLRNAIDLEFRPFIEDNEYRSLIVDPEGNFSHVEFNSLNPSGAFYRSTVLDDDFTDRVEPKTALDPYLLIHRVAESLAVLIAMCLALEWDESDHLVVALEIRGLAGRTLRAWARPNRLLFSGDMSRTDVVLTQAVLPLSTPMNGVGAVARQLLQKAIASFDGKDIPLPVYDDIVAKMIERAP